MSSRSIAFQADPPFAANGEGFNGCRTQAFLAHCQLSGVLRPAACRNCPDLPVNR